MVVVVAQGRSSIKNVNGRDGEILPFVGASQDGELAQFGVGYLYAGHAFLWGFLTPRLVIQSWRAMKLLEQLQRVDRRILCACWYAAGTQIHPGDEHYIGELAGQFTGRNEFAVIRRHILSTVPSPEELRRMLEVVKAHNIHIDFSEIEQLADQGKVPHLPIVAELREKTMREFRLYREVGPYIDQSVPPLESLVIFFRQLGINNFLIGPPHEASVTEWGHIPPDLLDAFVRRTSVTGGGVFTLFVAASSGEPSAPAYTGIDGTKYTFLHASLSQGVFSVNTRVEWPNGHTHTDEYTLQTLRQMVFLSPPILAAGKRRWRWPRQWR